MNYPHLTINQFLYGLDSIPENGFIDHPMERATSEDYKEYGYYQVIIIYLDNRSYYFWHPTRQNIVLANASRSLVVEKKRAMDNYLKADVVINYLNYLSTVKDNFKDWVEYCLTHNIEPYQRKYDIVSYRNYLRLQIVSIFIYLSRFVSLHSYIRFDNHIFDSNSFEYLGLYQDIIKYKNLPDIKNILPFYVGSDGYLTFYYSDFFEYMGDIRYEVYGDDLDLFSVPKSYFLNSKNSYYESPDLKPFIKKTNKLQIGSNDFSGVIVLGTLPYSEVINYFVRNFATINIELEINGVVYLGYDNLFFYTSIYRLYRVKDIIGSDYKYLKYLKNKLDKESYPIIKENEKYSNCCLTNCKKG